MRTLNRQQSRAVTQYSVPDHLRSPEPFPFPNPKQLNLRKSIFNPPQGLAQAFATRRHLVGVQVPLVEIVHYSDRWLLLQAFPLKTVVFANVNRGELGCKEEFVLKMFINLVALTKNYGYFRPTKKMIFLEDKVVKVWIHEDIFSINPMMPILGYEAEKNFVFAFLVLVQPFIGDWATKMTTIHQTLAFLERICRFAKERKSSLTIKQQSKITRSHLEFSAASKNYKNFNKKIPAISIKLDPLGKKFTDQPSEMLIPSIKEGLIQEVQQCFSPSSFNKFAPSSTSSTLQAFSDKWRSTVGRKKLMQRVQALEPILSPTSPVSASNDLDSIKSDLDGLFSQEGCDEAQLERITEEIEEILFM